MKKLLLMVVALIVGVSTASAQLVPIAKSEAIEELDAVRVRSVILNKHGDRFYIVMRSSNRFDKPGLFVLGDTKESAIATVVDLIKLCDQLKKGESVTVQNAGVNVSIEVQKMMGQVYVQFDMPGIAGILAGITVKDLKRFYKVIAGKEYTEQSETK